MTLLFDVILIAILVLCAIIGWKRGFLKSLGGFVSYIIAFAVANKFYKLLAKFVIEIPFLAKMITDVEMPPIPQNITFLDKVKFIFDYVSENATASDIDGSAEMIKAILNNYVAELIASLIGFIVMFAVTWLVLKLGLWLLELVVDKTPVIRQANGILGSIVGLLTGFFWTWVTSNLFVRFALPILNDKWPTVFVSELADSFVVRFCTEINPITYLFLLINLISG